MIISVLKDVITLYCWEMIINLYPVHWLILYLLRSVYCFFPFDFLSKTWLLMFEKKLLFLSFWNNYFLISSSSIDSLLAYICILFRTFWIIVAGMCVAFFMRNSLFYVHKMIVILHHIHWLIDYYFHRCVCHLFYLNNCSWYVYDYFYKKWSFFVFLYIACMFLLVEL